MKKTTTREDIYTRVTNTIIAALEQGVRPWTTPWSAGNTEGQGRFAALIVGEGRIICRFRGEPL